MKIVSWNVNSLRNAEVSFLEFMASYQPDVIFLQELRAHEDQLSFFLKYVEGYKFLFNDSGRPGYSGSAVYYKESLQVKNLTNKSSYEHLDVEGRYIACKVNGIELHSFYVPNGNSNDERYALKLAYHESMLKLAKRNRRKAIPTIITGDLNVCHTEKDLFDPTITYSCFRKEERKWFDNILNAGYIDSFREFNKEPAQYSWWHMRDRTRKQNRGYRFDYFLVSEDLKEKLASSKILKDVFGSDHCPIVCEIEG